MKFKNLAGKFFKSWWNQTGSQSFALKNPNPNPWYNPKMTTKLPENTFAHMNSDGEMEIIDIFTGDVIATQKSREEILYGTEEKIKSTLLLSGETEFLHTAPGENPIRKRYLYSDLQSAAICSLISLGKSVREISRTPGFPPVQIIRAWRRQNPEFEEAIQIAKKDRAEYFQELALGSVENIMSKDDASVAKVKLEAYRWAASVDDPDTFGNKTKISGDVNAPLTLMIDTGIRRANDTPVEKSVAAPVVSLPENSSLGMMEGEDQEDVDQVHDISQEKDSAQIADAGEF